MLDLDQYIHNSMKIKLHGKVYDVLEPTVAMNMEVDRIEQDLNRENLHEKRIEVAKLLLSHNIQEKTFSTEELEKVPFEGINQVLVEISLMRKKAELDPNSKSQSQQEK